MDISLPSSTREPPPASAWLDCSIEREIPAGDHSIVLLRVHDLDADPDVAPWSSTAAATAASTSTRPDRNECVEFGLLSRRRELPFTRAEAERTADVVLAGLRASG